MSAILLILAAANAGFAAINVSREKYGSATFSGLVSIICALQATAGQHG